MKSPLDLVRAAGAAMDRGHALPDGSPERAVHMAECMDRLREARAARNAILGAKFGSDPAKPGLRAHYGLPD